MSWCRTILVAITAVIVGIYLARLPDVNFTLKDIPTLTRGGKPLVSIVTGASNGLGLVTARELYCKGGYVILACRSEELAQAAMSSIKRECGSDTGGGMEYQPLELGSLASVRAFTTAFRESARPLNILVANAGIMLVPFSIHNDSGVESTLAVNHLGHALLILDLLSVLEASTPSRIVIVSSEAHRRGVTTSDPLALSTRQNPSTYNSFIAYGSSKLANILFTRSLASYESQQEVYVNSAHPGFVKTNLASGLLKSIGPSFRPIVEFLVSSISSLFAYSADDGAITQLYLATSPEVEARNIRGLYFVPHATLKAPLSCALNNTLANELTKWTFTVLSNAGYDFPFALKAGMKLPE